MTLLQLSHLTMRVATSNTNYLLLLCFCLVHGSQMYSVAKLCKGIMALQLMPAREVPAAIIPATVRLLWLQLLLPLQVCHIAPPTRPPFGPVRPTGAGTTLAARSEQRRTTISHASNTRPPYCRLSQVCSGGRAVWRRTTSEVTSSAAGVAWRSA